MGMDPRSGEYLTWANPSSHPDHSRMAFLHHRPEECPGKTYRGTGEILPSQHQRPVELKRMQDSAAVHPSGAADIVELIRTTRNDFEKMIAAVRKRRPDLPQPPAQEQMVLNGDRALGLRVLEMVSIIA